MHRSSTNFLAYCATKQHESSNIDAFLVMAVGYCLGRVLTIITSSGIWMTEQGVNHDLVFVHCGGQVFMSTTVNCEFLSSLQENNHCLIH